MIADLGRKGGKGAFALDKELEFSSEEDEEDGAGGKAPARAKQKQRENRRAGGDDASPQPGGKSLGGGNGAGGRDDRRGAPQSDVAPLINSVALDFVLRRWLSTCLGGLVLTWSAAPADERQPGLPVSVMLLQVVWLLYPALIGVVLNALYFEGVLPTGQGIMALIAGGVAALAHLAIHITHRSSVRRTAPAAAPAQRATASTSTRVADASSVSLASVSLAASVSLDNFEQQLQAQVKQSAIQAGTLPPKKQARDLEKGKKKPDAEREDSSSRPPDVPPRARHTAAAAADSDDEDDTAPPAGTPPLSFRSAALWSFLISPRTRPLSRTLLHALLSGVMMAGACYFLEWRATSSLFDPQVDGSVGPVAIVFECFAWLSFCICFYGLNIRPAPEANKYGGGEGFFEREIQAPLGRCAYMAAIIAFNLAVRLIAEFGDPRVDLSDTALDVHKVVVSFFPVLPALFATAALPPLDALVFWAAEQMNVLIFGGTVAANNLRTAVVLLAHAAASIVVFIVWLYASHSGAMLFALGLAFLLSWNGLPLSWGAVKPAAAAGKAAEDPDTPYALFRSRGLWHLSSWGTWLKIGLAALVCAIGVILGAGTDSNLIDALDVLHDADIAFDLVALVLFLLLWVLSEIYKPFLCFGLMKNPLYSRMVLQSRVTQFGNSAATDADAGAGVMGAIRNKINKHELLLWAVRAFLVLYVAFHESASIFEAGSSLSDDDARGRASLLAYSALLLRAFHVLFNQAPLHSLSQVLFVVVVNLVASAVGDDSDFHRWHGLDWSVRFLVAGFVLLRARDAMGKAWFMASASYTAFAFPKQRMRHPAMMRALCLLLIPYHLALLLVSSFLGTPVLPLLGAPVFLLAFPRPQRVWNEVGGRYGMNERLANTGGDDTVFYRQMMPSIYASIERALADGRLTYSSALQAGEFFLLRLEPYLLWVSVLERGLGYVVLQIKGLELATTSCHTVEALRIDEVMEVIDPSTFASTSLCAPVPQGHLYSYAPLLSLPSIRSFSITRNVLTGIIDDRDNLRTLTETLVRVVAREIRAELLMAHGGPEHKGEMSMQRLPRHWLTPTVSSFDLQQFEERVPWPTDYVSFLFSSGGATLPPTDEALFKKVVCSCVAIVDFLSADVVAAGGRTTAEHVLRTFEGKIGSSLQADYLLAKDNDDARRLKELVIRAYRLSFKALYDCAALASLEVLTTPSDPEQFREFHILLEEYSAEWMLDAPVENNPAWARAVEEGRLKLFSIARAVDKGSGAYTSLSLELVRVSLRMARVSSAAVRSFWCSLSLELLFFANDDDERYSIQAHPHLLRNLAVQASEPPLGYPVYSAQPTGINAH